MRLQLPKLLSPDFKIFASTRCCISKRKVPGKMSVNNTFWLFYSSKSMKAYIPMTQRPDPRAPGKTRLKAADFLINQKHCILPFLQKQARKPTLVTLEATLVWNYDLPTYSLTRVKSRATSVAKNAQWRKVAKALSSTLDLVDLADLVPSELKDI